MADIALVARQLNQVSSVGEERAAILAAQADVARGLDLAWQLSTFSSPTPAEASDTLNLLNVALAGEYSALDSSAANSPVDPSNWARARRQVERAYVEVSGIEGAAGAQSNIDVAQILGDAIVAAPKVFLGAVGSAAGEVLNTAGQAAAAGAGGFFSGLGLAGSIVLLVLVVVVLRVKGVV